MAILGSLSILFNLKTPICKTSPFQASYFNRIVNLWNFVNLCLKVAFPVSMFLKCLFCSTQAFLTPLQVLMGFVVLSNVLDARPGVLLPEFYHVTLILCQYPFTLIQCSCHGESKVCYPRTGQCPLPELETLALESTKKKINRPLFFKQSLTIN